MALLLTLCLAACGGGGTDDGAPGDDDSATDDSPGDDNSDDGDDATDPNSCTITVSGDAASEVPSVSWDIDTFTGSAGVNAQDALGQPMVGTVFCLFNVAEPNQPPTLGAEVVLRLPGRLPDYLPISLDQDSTIVSDDETGLAVLFVSYFDRRRDAEQSWSCSFDLGGTFSFEVTALSESAEIRGFQNYFVNGQAHGVCSGANSASPGTVTIDAVF